MGMGQIRAGQVNDSTKPSPGLAQDLGFVKPNFCRNLKGKGWAFSNPIFRGSLKHGGRTFFQNLEFSKCRVPSIQKMLILSSTASNHDLAASAEHHLIFLWAGC